MNQPPRKGPPPIETIISDAAGKTDTGYALRVHMVGLHGAWHRLWGLLILRLSLGDPDDAVEAVRAQVGQALGRPLTDAEMARLDEHAREFARSLTPPAAG
jgi:hypothetical protein